MAEDGQDLAGAQRRHWQETYAAHPGMYGEVPSDPARHAAGAFRAAGALDVLELGAGHGRDALQHVEAEVTPDNRCRGKQKIGVWAEAGEALTDDVAQSFRCAAYESVITHAT